MRKTSKFIVYTLNVHRTQKGHFELIVTIEHKKYIIVLVLSSLSCLRIGRRRRQMRFYVSCDCTKWFLLSAEDDT